MKAIKDGVLATSMATALSFGFLLGLTSSAPGDDIVRGSSSGIGSFFSGISDGATSLAHRLTGQSDTPKSVPVADNDPISLQNNAAPSAATFVSMAKIYEQAGQLREAEDNYRRALQVDAKYLAALLGQARIMGRTGRHNETLALYKRASLAYPRSGSVYNNLGTYYGQRRMFPESIAAYQQAVALDPQNTKYRDNLAIILAETGHLQEAFNNLQVAHGEDIAYYNLGFLLYKKGQYEMARQHFAAALNKNSNLRAAREMLQRLTPKDPVASPNPNTTQRNVTTENRTSVPRRLPPVAPNPPMLGSRPGISSTSR